MGLRNGGHEVLTSHRVETIRTIGLVSKFPPEADVWAEVERCHRAGSVGRATVNALADTYKSTELPYKASSLQRLQRHILDDYILVRWGKTYVDEVRVLELKKWFAATAAKNKLTSQTVQKIKQVFGRLYAYGTENELIPSNLNPVRLQHQGHRHRVQEPEQGHRGSTGSRVEDRYGSSGSTQDVGSTGGWYRNADQ